MIFIPLPSFRSKKTERKGSVIVGELNSWRRLWRHIGVGTPFARASFILDQKRLGARTKEHHITSQKAFARGEGGGRLYYYIKRGWPMCVEPPTLYCNRTKLLYKRRRRGRGEGGWWCIFWWPSARVRCLQLPSPSRPAYTTHTTTTTRVPLLS